MPEELGFVVVVDDLEVVTFTVNLDAAIFLDFLNRVFIAILGVDTVGGILAGQRDCGTQHDFAAGRKARLGKRERERCHQD
jgi:hypothetical protein